MTSPHGDGACGNQKGYSVTTLDTAKIEEEAKRRLIAAALAWFKLRPNCPYNNAELHELWKSASVLDAIHTLAKQ